MYFHIVNCLIGYDNKYILFIIYLYGGGQGLPSTIVFLLGLSLPATVVWAAFSCRGAKGLHKQKNSTFCIFDLQNAKGMKTVRNTRKQMKSFDLYRITVFCPNLGPSCTRYCTWGCVSPFINISTVPTAQCTYLWLSISGVFMKLEASAAALLKRNFYWCLKFQTNSKCLGYLKFQTIRKLAHLFSE